MKKFFKNYIACALLFTTAFTISLINTETLAFSLDTQTVSKSNSTSKYVVLGGQTFGIKLFTDGVMIIKTETIKTSTGVCSVAKNADLKINDVITQINDKKVTSNEQLGEEVKNCNGKPIKLKIRRDGEELERVLQPVKDYSGVYRIGIWVRDSSAGIGTVTYYDYEKGYFAALGHGICDSDTGALLSISHGDTVKANITSVTKGTKGTAGGLNGYFSDETIGDIICNTDYGLFGYIENIDKTNLAEDKIETASPSEVKTGDAYILSTIDNNGVQKYSVRIEAVAKLYENTNTKNMIIKITDEKLLAKTGGIVQGMSGSPIVQNGKLVGAVTHVFLNKPDTGYGIFIENMSQYFDEYEENVTKIAA